jgi:NADPH-dependent curcumin reductase CurA
MEGFIVFDYAAQYGQARKELAQWLAEGKLQRKETIIPGGLEAAEHGLVALYNGINTGMFSQYLASKLGVCTIY